MTGRFFGGEATSDRRPPRSEAVQEILGRPPGVLVRFGNVLLLIGTVVALFIAFSYRYPDIVEAKLVLTTVNPAERLRAPRDVTVEHILIESEDTVASGTVLMVFRSLAEFQHVLFLEDQLISVRDGTDSTIAAVQIPNSLELGSIQEALYDFEEKREDYLTTRDRRYSGLSSQEVQRRIGQQQRALNSERRQREVLEQELILATRELESQRNLLNNGLIEEADLRTAEQAELRVRRLMRSSESQIRDLRFNIELLQNQLVSSRSSEENQLMLKSRDLRESFGILYRAVETWRQRNLLTAPKNGVVVTNIDVREQQRFGESNVLATLLPLNPEGVLGRIDLPLQGSGKVAVGQRVVIKFLNYPYEEFGSVEGRVQEKSPIPSGEVIPILISLPRGMVTNTGNTLEPVQFMQGDAEIIVGERRLLGWLLERGSSS